MYTASAWSYNKIKGWDYIRTHSELLGQLLPFCPKQNSSMKWFLEWRGCLIKSNMQCIASSHSMTTQCEERLVCLYTWYMKQAKLVDGIAGQWRMWQWRFYYDLISKRYCKYLLLNFTNTKPCATIFNS